MEASHSLTKVTALLSTSIKTTTTRNQGLLRALLAIVVPEKKGLIKPLFLVGVVRRAMIKAISIITTADLSAKFIIPTSSNHKNKSNQQLSHGKNTALLSIEILVG